MNEEIEKTSGDQREGKESNVQEQDEISKLIDEMQGEENSSEMEDMAEKTPDDEIKKESDETKADESEGKKSSNLNQEDIPKLIDKVQTEEKSSEAEEEGDKTEHIENDNEGENIAKSEMPEDENTQTAENNDDNVKENEIEEKAGSQEQDEKSVSEDKKSEKETDEKDKREENDEDKDKKSKKDADGGQAVILKEVKKKSKSKRVKLFISFILCVVFFTVLFGVYTFFKKSGTDDIKPEKSFQSEQIAKPGDKYSEEHTTQQIKDYETKDIILSDSIIAKLDEITKLRDDLFIKKKDIADLIKNYKNGISEMEDEILREKQNSKMDSFSDAIKNKKIEFGMMTIQRRLAYIEKIDPPYKWLNQGVEELLYLKHKIEIDSKVSSVISGIDMNKMIQEIDIVVQSYRNGIENIKINMKNVELIPLEMIWKRIIDKEKYAEVNNEKNDESLGINKPALANEEKNNRMIWKEICSGNFKRKNEMTNISSEAAKCLSKWKHADLFLNGISELSPEVARYLLKWEGNWVCLNGVKKLSPEAAKLLFQWQGNWVSLNGLSQISSGLLKHLPEWQGKQLELMGLKYKGSKSEKIGFKSLAKWEKAGGKLYIPVQIRKVINKL